MKKIYLIVMISMLLFVVYSAPCLAGWLFFSKPAYKGKVIDAETKVPIGGAVVVVIYEKHVYGPAGGYPSVIKVKETLTDKNGEFFFPSYSTIIHPVSREDDTCFIIYKPGYGNYPDKTISPPSGMTYQSMKNFFAADKFGKQMEVKVRVWKIGKKKHTTQKVTFGLVELPLLKTRKERLRAIPGRPAGFTGFRSKKLPLLFKAINDEHKRFGLKPAGRP